MMKAAMYYGPRDVSVAELPMPVIGKDDVLLQNLHAGICRSDVQAYLYGPRAHRLQAGSEFGHEVVSRVAAKGSNITDVEIGQRVYPYPLRARGDSRRAGTLGGFSEYLLCPNCRLNDHVYAIPDSISDLTASLIEPFTVSVHAARRAIPQPGETALVFGAGTIGILIALALKYLGCSQVMIVDLVDFRLKKAAALGLLTCNSRTEDLFAKAIATFGAARGLTRSVSNVDIYVDAAGDQALTGTFAEMAKLFSRLVMVAVYAEPVPIDLATLAFAHHSIIGAGGYFPEDVITVLEIMASGIYDLESLVTHRFPLEEIQQALEIASDREHSLHVSIDHGASRVPQLRTPEESLSEQFSTK